MKTILNNAAKHFFCSSILAFFQLTSSTFEMKNHLPILTFHRIVRLPDPIINDTFESRSFFAIMAAIAQHFNVLLLSEAIDKMKTEGLPPRPLSITFDDGYAENVQVVLPILKQLGLHATFFIPTGFLNNGWMWNDGIIHAVKHTKSSLLDLSSLKLQVYDVTSLDKKRKATASLLAQLKYLDPETRFSHVTDILEIASVKPPRKLMLDDAEIKALRQAGMEIGGHTVTHPILTTLDDKTAFREIHYNREQLAQLTGMRPRVFAYPNGRPGLDYGPQHVKMVKDIGYSAAVSTTQGFAHKSCDAYQLPRFTPWDRDPDQFIARLIYHWLRTRISEFITPII